MNQGKNCYSPTDAVARGAARPKVFLSHRNDDKEAVRAIARLLKALDVHYWLDEDDQDIKTAAALGLVGDRALVHAVERGVQHSSMLLGTISQRTQGSWWVPYEVGYSRALGKPVSFVALRPGPRNMTNPEFVRVASVYWSVDEVVRWVAGLAGHHLHSDLSVVDSDIYEGLARHLRLDPPVPTFRSLFRRAVHAVDLLAKPGTQREVRPAAAKVDWLATVGGPVRDIAYDLMVPLVYDDRRFSKQIRTRLSAARRSFALYCALAKMNPLPIREPKTRKRLKTSDLNQFRKRLATFLMATNRRGDLRLATREEFKAEFDRVLLSDNESAQSLGDLLNPLFGFTPAAGAVFDRLLPMLRDLYSAIANDAEPFRRR